MEINRNGKKINKDKCRVKSDALRTPKSTTCYISSIRLVTLRCLIN